MLSPVTIGLTNAILLCLYSPIRICLWSFILKLNPTILQANLTFYYASMTLDVIDFQPMSQFPG